MAKSMKDHSEQKAGLELWRAYRRTKDRALRDQLIEADLPLVKYVAARIASRLPKHLRLDDLYSAGLLGYLAAVEDFDPDRGVQFSAYATHRVRGAIFDELRRLDWVPRGVRERIRDAHRAIDTLLQRLDRHPTDEEIAAELGIDTEAYRRSLADGVTLVSLTSTASADGDGPALTDNVEDTATPDPFSTMAAEERREILARLIEKLPERERQVLALYYHEELTMREVGTVLGVTESRVSQLHSSAVQRLTVMLRRQRIGAEELVLARGPSTSGRSHRR
jgi:RNA polymerase sigma factor for flagellar operon FliA